MYDDWLIIHVQQMIITHNKILTKQKMTERFRKDRIFTFWLKHYIMNRTHHFDFNWKESMTKLTADNGSCNSFILSFLRTQSGFILCCFLWCIGNEQLKLLAANSLACRNCLLSSILCFRAVSKWMLLIFSANFLSWCIS